MAPTWKSVVFSLVINKSVTHGGVTSVDSAAALTDAGYDVAIKHGRSYRQVCGAGL